MKEIEESEKDDSVFVTIGGGGKDIISYKSNKKRTKQEIADETNKFINDLAFKDLQRNTNEDYESEYIKDQLKDMKIRSCQLLDEKSKELIKRFKAETEQAEREMIERARRREVHADIKKNDQQDSLIERLQSENPFDEFQRELEKALKRQAEEKAKAESEGDTDKVEAKNNEIA